MVNIDGPKACSLPRTSALSLRGTKQPSAPINSTFNIRYSTSYPAPNFCCWYRHHSTPQYDTIRDRTSSPQQITLLYCNTSEETTAYAEELHALAQKSAFHPCFIVGVRSKTFGSMQNAKNTQYVLVYCGCACDGKES